MKRLTISVFFIFALSGIAFADTCNCTPTASVGNGAFKGTGSTVSCPCVVVGTTVSSPTSVCGNSACESGENSSTCCKDCYGNPASSDGVCCAASGETSCNSSDCGVCPPACGNARCETNEHCGESNYCLADCGACPVICGQYGCQAGESCSNCSRDCGTCNTCLLAGTPITMADGTTKSIEQIKKGDVVLAFDEKTKQFKPDKVKKTLTHTSDGYLIINYELKITANHPVYSHGKWTQVGRLNKGDVLFDEKGKSVQIDSKEYVPGKIKTYNIIINPYHTYIANGYVVHNGGTAMSGTSKGSLPQAN